VQKITEKTARKNNRKNNNRAQAHKKIYNYGRRTKRKNHGYSMLDCGFIRSGIFYIPVYIRIFIIEYGRNNPSVFPKKIFIQKK